MDAKKVAIWVGVALVILVVGFLVLKPAAAGIIDVDSQELQELMDDGVRVIDVRTEGEYQAGHIGGAELVPVNQIPAAAQTWDPAEPIAIYCATGSRSSEVVNYLAEQGFQTIYHLSAGIVSWEGEVERGAATETSAEVEAPGTPVMYEFYTDS